VKAARAFAFLFWGEKVVEKTYLPLDECGQWIEMNIIVIGQFNKSGNSLLFFIIF
jgi:hypothetical protein